MFRYLCSSPNVIKVRMDETDGTHIMLVGYEKIKANLAATSEENKPVEITEQRWEDKIKTYTYLKYTEYENICIEMAQNRTPCRFPFKMAMHFQLS